MKIQVSKKHVVLLFFAFFVNNNYAQIDFRDHMIFKDNQENYANGPLTLYTVDIDSDGDLDVLSASYASDMIGWHENIDGTGVFGDLQVISSNANAARYVYGADIDGDGDIDVLSASEGDNKIAWYENMDGKGDFSAEKIISTTTYNPREVYAADIDGDGDMDIVSASYGNLYGIIVWYENLDDSNNFGDRKVIVNGVGPHSVYPVDFDKDGSVDLLTAYNDELHWYRNDGAGNLARVQKIHSYNRDYYRSIYPSDLDSDGDFDILFTYGSNISWSENVDGKGTFGTQQLIKDNSRIYESCFAADLDGDGDKDVLTASGSGNTISWLENMNGAGNFGNEKSISINAMNAIMVSADDINGDGSKDVLSVSFDDDRLSWYPNMDGKGDFSIPQSIAANISWINTIELADINNNDGLDVVFSSHSGLGGKIGWYTNSTTTNYFDIQHSVMGTPSEDPESIMAVDIDNDGDLDLVNRYGAHSVRLVWRENLDSKGNFSEEKIIYEGVVNLTIAQDIDGDTDLDIIIHAAYEAEKILWFENEDGKGSFSPKKTLYEFSGDYDIKAFTSEDLDKDGDNDIVFSYDSYNSAGYDLVYWLPNTDGKGTFNVLEYLGRNADHATSMKIVDVDSDGDLDIAISFFPGGSGSNGGVEWLENDQLEFTSAHRIQNGESHNLSFDDLDLDGDLDIITNNRNDVVWYENLGQGSFGTSQEISSIMAYFNNDIFTGDIDKDGDIDILSADLRTLLWSENMIIDATLSMEDPIFDSHKIVFYPNPIRKDLNIKTKYSVGEIKIYNNLGQLVLTDNNKNKIDLSMLDPGIYFIQLNNDFNVTTHKVIKE